MRNDATSTLVSSISVNNVVNDHQILPWSLHFVIFRRDEDRLADNDEIN